MQCCHSPFLLAWCVCPVFCLFHKRWGLLDLVHTQQVLQQRKVTKSVYLMTLFLCLGSMCPLTTGIFMEKLTSKKLCPDDDCVYTNSLARAEEDYNVSDCSFINIKKVINQLKADEDCFKISHYTPPCLKVYGEQYENYMGTVGYVPSSSVSEQHVYQEASQPVPTRVRNLQRPS
uniref:Uncharacterized protein n=1 Tax=Taeniopygia guttata TaxID=59729 RepID=A0A674H5C5_TAEGU